MAADGSDRLITLEVPALGADVLIVESFSGREELSRPFAFELEMHSERANIAPEEVVGETATVHLLLGDGSTRPFNGVLAAFARGGFAKYGARLYRATMVPAFALLRETRDIRIFQDMKVDDIVSKVLNDAGIELEISSGDFKREARGYCVQYRESDFNFVSRLLEEEGISYFFEHQRDSHKMIIGDAERLCNAEPSYELELRVEGTDAHDRDDLIDEWSQQYAFIATDFTRTDYDYENPSARMLATLKTQPDQGPTDGYENYDYPGVHATKADGDKLVKLRVEEEEVVHATHTGRASFKELSPAAAIEVKDTIIDETVKLTLVAVEHNATSSGFESGQGGGESYTNRFECISNDRPFRPRRLTPRPIADGPHTALVVGPSGEEIHIDDFGRIKVQFHWDRDGKKDENSSCWVRTSQVWAGNNWGAYFWPRIGHEVIVDFVNGNPDRPIVIGSVYNGEQAAPYISEKTKGGIKSHTEKGGANDYNELRFEDKKGSEEVYVQAQRDYKRLVKHDDSHEIENNQTVLIKTGNRDVTLDTGNDSLTVSKGNREDTLSTGNDALTISKGNRTTKINIGKDLTQAGTSIELKVGASSIKITPSGITLQAPQINIKGQAMTTVEGAMTTVKGSGMLTLQGGIIKIN